MAGQILCHSCSWKLENFLLNLNLNWPLWLVWPVECGRNEAMPVQGVAFKEVAQSLLVLLCGSLISCKKSDYSEFAMQWGSQNCHEEMSHEKKDRESGVGGCCWPPRRFSHLSIKMWMKMSSWTFQSTALHPMPVSLTLAQASSDLHNTIFLDRYLDEMTAATVRRHADNRGLMETAQAPLVF